MVCGPPHSPFWDTSAGRIRQKLGEEGRGLVWPFHCGAHPTVRLELITHRFSYSHNILLLQCLILFQESCGSIGGRSRPGCLCCTRLYQWVISSTGGILLLLFWWAKQKNPKKPIYHRQLSWFEFDRNGADWINLTTLTSVFNFFLCAVYKEDVKRLCEQPLSGSSAATSHSWKSIILLVPVRLGGHDLNPAYIACVKVFWSVLAVLN